MLKLDYAKETFAQVSSDLVPLLKNHWEEIDLYQRKLVFNPHWSYYAELDGQDRLCIVTARHQKELVGYAVSVVGYNPHSAQNLHGHLRLVYVKPGYRAGTGAGIELLRLTEAFMKAKNVVIFEIDTPTEMLFLLAKIKGYTQQSRVMVKHLGG